MLLTDILENNAKKFSDKTALTMRMGYRTVSLSYGETLNLARQVAVFLERQGLKKGDRVLLLAPNSPFWVSVWWGCLLRGYIVVPLNIQSTSEMVRKIAEQTQAKIMFKYLHLVQAPTHLVRYDVEFLKEVVGNIDTTSWMDTKHSENDIAQIMYTSGTTGDPKGVILTHKNLYSNLDSLAQIIPISPDDRFLSILPLSHIYEQMAGFLLPFYHGCKIVYAHSPTVIRDLLKEHQITKMAAVPEFLRIVMSKIEAKAEEEGKKKLFDTMMALSFKIGDRTIQRLIFHSVHKKFGGKLRTVASGGAPLDPLLEKKWNALGINLLQGYGLTETSPLVSCNTYKDHRLGSIGKILPGVEVSIAKDGEILVKGPNVFQGYFKNEQKTQEAFTSDGWFKTGDIGELDKDGFLFIKGRKKYMIKGPGAQNVYPEDIEFELNKIPGVKDSAVVGLEKSGGQVEIHAVLLLTEEVKPSFAKASEGAVKQANAKLASYQQIAGWSIWPEEDFPRSATRKVKKEEVLRWLDARKTAPFFAKTTGDEKKTPLERLLAEITGIELVLINQNTKIVSELALDSLLRIELVARIEEKFGVMVDEASITASSAVSDLEEMMRTAAIPAKRPVFKRWPLGSVISFIRTALQTFLIFPIFRTFVKLRVEGLEHLKDLSLPAVFMPNHLSYLDSVAVAMAVPARIRKRIVFAAAVDAFYKPYRCVVPIVELCFNVFPFPRQEHENIKFGLEYMGRLLDRGWSIVVYPEGRMSLTGKLQPLKRGAGLVATEMDYVIVPIKIIGTQEVVPPGKLMPLKRGEVIVRFGKPLKFKRSDSYIEATEEIHRVMAKL